MSKKLLIYLLGLSLDLLLFLKRSLRVSVTLLQNNIYILFRVLKKKKYITVTLMMATVEVTETAITIN